MIDFGGRHFETVLAAMFFWRHWSDTKLAARRKAGKWLDIFHTAVGKISFFSKRFSTSLSSMSSFRSLKHFWLRIICLTSLFKSHLDKIFWTELRHENAAWLLSTAQNFGNDIWIVVFFRGKFHRENLHFRGKLRWVAKLSARFLFALTKKYTTFSFMKISPFINMNKKNSKEEL